MDISTLVANARTIDIKHPVSLEPIGLQITLLPPSDPKVQAARRRLLNERLNRDAKLTAERIEQNDMELLIAAISGWDWQGDLTFQGKKPEFAETNVRQVLKALPWVKEQIDRDLGDSAAFFGNSATA